MTTLPLQRLAEIEAAASKADVEYWNGLSRYLSDMSVDATPTLCNLNMITLCDPATVAALCRIARAAVAADKASSIITKQINITRLHDALRAAGLIE